MRVTVRRLVTCLLSPICIVPASAGHVLLRYLDFGSDIDQQGLVEAVAADSAGNLFTIAAVTKLTGRSPMRVIKTDPNGSVLARFDIDVVDAFSSFATATATDAQGNLVIAGLAGASGVPLVSPLFPAVKANEAAFVMKLDSRLQGIVFSTLLGGGTAYAVATDAPGNIYVAGETNDPDFPITPGAYQTKPPGRNATYDGQNSYAFLTEISPNGDRLLYSTYFGGDSVICPFDGSVCQFVGAGTAGTALAIAQSGAVVMAGRTDAFDLPVTPGTLATSCADSTASGTGFIAEFLPGLAELKWSTCLNATGMISEYQTLQIYAASLDQAGNVFVAGMAPPGVFPTTTGVVQPSVHGNSQLLWAGFIAKLSSTGASLVWSTYFGAGDSRGVNALAVDPLGKVVVTGYSDPNWLPSGPGVPPLGDSFSARLSADGSTLEDLYVGPELSTGQAVALTPASNFMAEGSEGCMWIEKSDSGPSLLGAANAAVGLVSGLVSPWELISLYGNGIGPQTAAPGQVQNGAFTSSLGGYQVLFDGIPAPLLYAGPTQINTIVPREVQGQDYTHLQITGPSGTIDGPTLSLRPAEPEIFMNTQTGFADALNEDGGINSPQNPAKPGSVVSIFTTGNGPSVGSDGQLLTDAYLGNSLPVAILSPGSTSLEVLYAADAPGLVAGVFQINFRLPTSLPPGGAYAFQLQVNGELSRAAFLAVPR